MFQNITAIVDKDYQRCFVLPLNRSNVIPPKDFWDLVNKIGVRLIGVQCDLSRDQGVIIL